MIVVTGRAVIKQEKLVEAIAAASEISQLSQAEPGCITYKLYSNPQRPVEFFLFEEWEAQTDLDRHFQSEHFKRFSTILPDLIDDAMVMRRYEVKNVSNF